MRICLFGGTFDPPHIGHLLVAQTIFEAEGFDRIIFIPAYLPPNKVDAQLSPIHHRREMLKLAIKDNPNFEISDIEIDRKGISYSLDTIRLIKDKLDLKSEETYYLIGSDTLQKLPAWHHTVDILKESRVIVAVRPGFRPSDIPNWVLGKVHFANIPRFEVSSTTIRERWRENKTIRYMVTQAVWEYINQHILY